MIMCGDRPGRREQLDVAPATVDVLGMLHAELRLAERLTQKTICESLSEYWKKRWQTIGIAAISQMHVHLQHQIFALVDKLLL